jgi:D-alanyl-D-alanine endopeptidase (penicillin-binding protein 7)
VTHFSKSLIASALVASALGLSGLSAQAAVSHKHAKPAPVSAVKAAGSKLSAKAKHGKEVTITLATAVRHKGKKADAQVAAGHKRVPADEVSYSRRQLAAMSPRARAAAVRQMSPAALKAPVVVVAAAVAPKQSFGQMAGLHDTADELALKSSVALVMDQETNEVLLSKNSQAVLPIASLTKLMTALVVTEAKLPLDEMMSVTDEDVDTEKFSSSRLLVGTELRRGEMLHLALMSSENRAAHALGRSYPGGLPAFVSAMNLKARELGMRDTRYVEPTGLSSQNQSSARDLATLVKAAYQHQIIRELSTSPEYQVEVGHRQVQYHNTNGLVKSPAWDIGLQKTGYISEAGRCLVMQARMAGRKLIMVFLDSAGKYSRIGDAERVRKWISDNPAGTVQAHAIVPKVN